MMAEAEASPGHFDAIVCHSQSRFYRDHIDLGLAERRLAKKGIELISITQPTSGDPNGVLVRNMLAVIDEHASRENAKHTLRAMKENARQGYWNGSRPPFGYKVIEVEAQGRHGKKRKLAVDDAEATSVRRVFELYLYGEQGGGKSLREVASWLNSNGYSRRGRSWSKRAVHEVLTNSAYVGEHWFNRKSGKTGEVKPRSEWVKLQTPRIVENDAFRAVSVRLASRSPTRTATQTDRKSHASNGNHQMRVVWIVDDTRDRQGWSLPLLQMHEPNQPRARRLPATKPLCQRSRYCSPQHVGKRSLPNGKSGDCP